MDAATSTPTSNGTTWTYCNPSGIVIPANSISGPASPNPSNIFVTNQPGTISDVTVTLNGLNLASNVIAPESLLVGPNGQNLDFFSTQAALAAPLPLKLTFGDLGATTPCTGTVTLGTLLAPVSCGSTSYVASPFYPLPGTYQHASPTGQFTFNTGTYTPTSGGAFSNIDSNGTWSLYLYDRTPDDTGSIGSSCINLTENPPKVNVQVGHIGTGPNNTALPWQSVTITNLIENGGPARPANLTGTTR